MSEVALTKNAKSTFFRGCFVVAPRVACDRVGPWTHGVVPGERSCFPSNRRWKEMSAPVVLEKGGEAEKPELRAGVASTAKVHVFWPFQRQLLGAKKR